MKVTYGAIVQRASGRFGGTVHSNWKGVDVVRRFAKPSNPNSALQQDVRNIFRNLTKMYTLLPTETKASWVSFAVGKPLIARNKLVGVNVPLLQGEIDFGAMQPTPGDSSTIPLADYNPTGGVAQITTTVTTPTIPAGWAITGVVAVAINDAGAPGIPDPITADLQMYEAIDLASAYTPNITGLPAGTYYSWGFIKWLAPDGSVRYSAPLGAGSVVVT